MSEKELLEPRKKPSQERSRKTMAAIYEAAVHIFADIGYADATTDQIAEKAGVSIGTLYHYFSGKEAILYGLWERHMDQIKTLTQDIEKDIRRQGFFDRGIVPILMHLVLELVSYDNMQNRLFVSPIGLPDTILQKRRELGLYIESAMEAVFRDVTNVRIENHKIGVHIIWATVQAVIHDYILLAPNEIKEEDLLAELSDMLSRYVFTDDAEEIITAKKKIE
ncbi:MAG: TetR/AcrR family transcriptional regulator [Smithella sp.]|jgi:AcrR family transcriptional regulator